MSLPATIAMQYQNVYLDPSMVSQCEEFPVETYEYWKCYIQHKTNPENHQVGTCRMGAINNCKSFNNITNAIEPYKYYINLINIFSQFSQK